jgi:hypothetical protein
MTLNEGDTFKRNVFSPTTNSPEPGGEKSRLVPFYFAIMRKCRACDKPMPESARRCPHCGAGVIEETLVCPSCGEENDLLAADCRRCGFSCSPKKKEVPKPPPNNIFDTSHLEKTEQEFADKFSEAFRRRIVEEHDIRKFKAYADRFFQSGFKTSVDFRVKQLAEQAEKIAATSEHPKRDKRLLLERAFDELLDYFIIRFCSDLNDVALPEVILKYQRLTSDKVNLPEMIFDYLEFEREDESVFTNFVTMPAQKLRNAAKSFLFPEKGETIFFICDLSVLANCKEGFAMTTKGIYWKMLMEKPQRVYYHKLKEVNRQEDWLTINGIFFNANHSLNMKLMRLLKKLRELFAN